MTDTFKPTTSVYFLNEWKQVTQSCAWYTFRPICLEIEWDRSYGGVEVIVVLFGLGVRIRHTYAQTEQARDIAKHVAALRKEWGINDD